MLIEVGVVAFKGAARWLLLVPILFFAIINYSNYQIIKITGVYLSPQFFKYFNTKDIFSDFGRFVIFGALEPIPIFFTIIAPLLFFILFLRHARGQKAKQRLIILTAFSTAAMGFFYITHSLYRQFIPEPSILAKSFYLDGVKDIATPLFFDLNIKPKPLVPLTLGEIAKYKKISSELTDDKGYIRPYLEMPYFKIGKKEYCRLEKKNQASTPVPCAPEDLEPITPNRKNIVMISLESFRSLSFDGLSDIWTGITPHLGKRMQEGAWFSRMFSVNRPTNLSLSSYLCSVPGVSISLPDMEPMPEIICLSDILSSLGYRGACISAAPSDFQNYGRFCTNGRVDDVLGGKKLLEHFDIHKSDWAKNFVKMPDDKQLLEVSGRWIKDHYRDFPNDPFYMLIKTATHHYPWPNPPFEKYEKMKVGPETSLGEATLLSHRLMRFVDDAAEEFLQWLYLPENAHIAKDTIVIFFGDHAPWLLEPGVSKLKPADIVESWVPFFILGLDSKWNKEYSSFAASYDMVPSIMEILNVRPPNSFVGRNLFSDKKGSFIGFSPNIVGTGDVIKIDRPWQGMNAFKIRGKMQLSAASKAEEIAIDTYLEEKKPFEQLIIKNISDARTAMPANFSKEALDQIYGLRKSFKKKLAQTDK